MKTFKILPFIFSISVIATTIFSQNGWMRQQVPTTKTLIGMYFINDTTGWVVGDSGIFCSTTNGGTTWNKTSINSIYTLRSIYFKNPLTGIVGGLYTSNFNGYIFKTTNGGINWNPQSFSGVPYDIFSFGGDTVWASRHDGYVMKSTNLGVTWASTFVLQQLELYTVYFINNMTGWTGGAVYGGYAFIFKTTDGGITWFNQFITWANHFYGIYFINDQTGYTTTLSGTIYGTTNGGTDWITKLSGTSSILFKVKFPVPDTGFAVGANKRILITTNSGTNWFLQFTPVNIPNVTFTNVNFRNSRLGWVIGESGVILKTTNGGYIGINPVGNKIPENFSLSQNYPNPFNPTTTIDFNIPEKAYTKLVIYDIAGKDVELLVDQELSGGSYRITFDGSKLSSGVYYYKLIADDFMQTKKLVLLK